MQPWHQHQHHHQQHQHHHQCKKWFDVNLRVESGCQIPFHYLDQSELILKKKKIILNICLLPQKQQWMCIYSCNHIRQRGATWPTGFYLIFIRFPQSSHINHVLAFTNMFLFRIHFAKTHVLTSMAWLEKAKKKNQLISHYIHEPYPEQMAFSV